MIEIKAQNLAKMAEDPQNFFEKPFRQPFRRFIIPGLAVTLGIGACYYRNRNSTKKDTTNCNGVDGNPLNVDPNLATNSVRKKSEVKSTEEN